MDEKKKDSSSSSSDTCTVTTVKHGPNCPVTKAFREVAEQIVGAAGEKADAENHGPSKVNSPAFKAGWDAIDWGKRTVGQA